MKEYHKPDTGEKCIRFGCGFVFGGLAAFLSMFGWLAMSEDPSWLYVAGLALLSGFLAMRYGDEFWHSDADDAPWFHNFFRGWWPW